MRNGLKHKKELLWRNPSTLRGLEDVGLEPFLGQVGLPGGPILEG